ncbi:MAG TPA: c-type cytochrome domain-containing protein, partial [Terriglobales bacterium]
MRAWSNRIPAEVSFRLFGLAPVLILLALLVFFPPDGNERAEWAQFIGRFHPVAVHVPIALILLVPILEWAGRNRRFPYLRPSAGFVLGLATLSAIVAAILGWDLARSGGYSGPLMTQHMWGGLSLTALCWLCWLLRGPTGDRRWELPYLVALVATVGLMGWTGYRGSQLSHGEDHLTEHMPALLRKALGLSGSAGIIPAASSSGVGTFFAARVQPIFAGHCFTCHGPDKHKANLRLDSYQSVMRGSKNGLVVKAGNLQGSELFRRITLPPTDDDFMPKEGKRPLSADAVKVIELWIAAGASAALPV